MNIPKTRLSTRLSGSAREAENRIRNIFQGQRRRPPVPLILAAALAALLCGSLVSCHPREDGPTVAMQLQYYDDMGNFLEIPTFRLPEGEEASYPQLAAVNQDLDQLAQSYQYLLDAPWEEMGGAKVLAFPATTERYLNLTLYSGYAISYGTDGSLSSYVYDKEENRLLTEEDALALAGVTREELLDSLAALIAAEDPPRTATETEIQGFRVYDDGSVDIYLSTLLPAEEVPEVGWLDGWRRLYLWRDGTYTRDTGADPCPRWLWDTEGLDQLSPALWYQWSPSGEPEGGFSSTARGELLHGTVAEPVWDAVCAQASASVQALTGAVPERPADYVNALSLVHTYEGLNANSALGLPLSTEWGSRPGSLYLDLYELILQIEDTEGRLQYEYFYLPVLRGDLSLTPLPAIAQEVGYPYEEATLHSLTPLTGALLQRMADAGVLSQLPSLEADFFQDPLPGTLSELLFMELTNISIDSPAAGEAIEGMLQLDSFTPALLHPLADGDYAAVFAVQCHVWENGSNVPDSFYLFFRLTGDRQWGQMLGTRPMDEADLVSAAEALAAAPPLTELEHDGWRFFMVNTALPISTADAPSSAVTLYGQRQEDPVPRIVTRLSRTEAAGLELSSFRDVLGYDGILLSFPSNPPDAQYYYAVTDQDVTLIAPCYENVYQADLDGDGTTELISNYYPTGYAVVFRRNADGSVYSYQLNQAAARLAEWPEDTWVSLTFDPASQTFSAQWDSSEGGTYHRIWSGGLLLGEEMSRSVAPGTSHLTCPEVALHEAGDLSVPLGPGRSYVPHGFAETIQPDWEPVYNEGDHWSSWRSEDGDTTLWSYYEAEQEQHTVYTIDTVSPSLATYRNIHVGSTRAEVLAAYPTLRSDSYWAYEGDYLWFQMDEYANSHGYGPAILFYFEGDRVSRILLNNMFD